MLHNGGFLRQRIHCNSAVLCRECAESARRSKKVLKKMGGGESTFGAVRNGGKNDDSIKSGDVG